MANLVSLIKHPISGAYLNLNTSVSTEVVLNLDHIVSAEYNPNYPNGYMDEKKMDFKSCINQLLQDYFYEE